MPDGDPAVAEAVIRVPQYDGGPDQLQTSIGGYNTRVVYDMAADVFIDEHDLNDLEPVGHVAQPNSRNLRPLDTPREVTDAMRTRSLRALGVDLPLPVHLPVMAEGSTPIPKQISCLWVGDRVIDPSLIDNLASNAARLRDSEYGLQLFLSTPRLPPTPRTYAC